MRDWKWIQKWRCHDDAEEEDEHGGKMDVIGARHHRF